MAAALMPMYMESFRNRKLNPPLIIFNTYREAFDIFSEYLRKHVVPRLMAWAGLSFVARSTVKAKESCEVSQTINRDLEKASIVILVPYLIGVVLKRIRGMNVLSEGWLLIVMGFIIFVESVWL
jgi:hypothetical protein